MRKFVFTFSFVHFFLAMGQFTDDFSDGDFSTNPTWFGDVSEFVILDNMLRLQNESPQSTNESYLVLPSTAIDDGVWEFSVGFDGLPTGGLSGSNRMFIYLTADKANLEDSPNGYYILVGGTSDEISLFSTQSGKLIDGVDDVTMTSDTTIRVRVTRDDLGNWELLLDDQNGTGYLSQGRTTNLDFTTSSFFGVLCDYTSTRSNSFFFDDFVVSGTAPRDTILPFVTSVEVVSQTELLVVFSEPMDKNSAEDLANYDIQHGTVIGANLVMEAQLSLTVEGVLENVPNTLTLQNIADLSGNNMMPKSFDFAYYVTEVAQEGDIIINEFLSDPINSRDDFVELYNRSEKAISLEGWTISDESSTSGLFDFFVFLPDSYVIIYDDDASINYAAFGNSLTVPSLTLNNDNDLIEIKNDAGISIAFLEYGSISEEGVSLELINPNDPCISFSSYRFSSDPAGGTPGRVNSVFDDRPDTDPPLVVAHSYTAENLMIQFSEVMDASSLSKQDNYQSDDLSLNSIEVIGKFPEAVRITFASSVVPGRMYEVALGGLKDCAGNNMDPTVISFAIGQRPSFNEIIITELLYDETPAVGLPEREYVELFNATDNVLSTANLWLTDATSTARLPDFTMNPREYYVLTSPSAVAEFDQNTVGVSGFPSLNNAGEQLILSLGDTLISSLDYDPAWHDEGKAEGGYALEMVDVANPCLESAANWRSSTHPSGGTPGSANSVSDVVPDNFGPVVTGITALALDTIKIDFSESIDPQSVSGTIGMEPTVVVKEIFFDYQEPRSLFAILEDPLEVNTPYRVTVSDVFDCGGNEVQSSELVFSLPVEAAFGEVKLSEVLFNPRPNGVDFVEIYNDSENYINLRGWGIARITSNGIDDRKNISSEVLVLNPNAYLVLTSSIDLVVANYPSASSEQLLEIASLPTYANDTGNVVLLNETDEIMERFFYREDYHSSLLERVDGVSLERISFSAPTNDPHNWRSASSIEGFATPGYANSQRIPTRRGVAKLEISPKVFVPGNSASGKDFTTINYQLSNPGQFANVNIYDQNGRLVRNLAKGELLSTSGFLRWDGETNSGSMARLGYYVILFEVYDANGSTEILKETVVVGRDF